MSVGALGRRVRAAGRSPRRTPPGSARGRGRARRSGGASELLPTLDDVEREADRPRLVRNRALDRLADPPVGIGRELVAEPPVELLDRAVQAERALLSGRGRERNAEAAIAVGDRDDEAQVRVDHLLLAARSPLSTRLARGTSSGRAQQPVAADLGEEELDPISARAEASCASSSSGVIFRAMLRLDPGEGSGSAPRPLARRARGGDVAGFGCQGEARRRAAARTAATQHAPSVPRYTSGSSERARKRRCRSRRQCSGTRPACPSCLRQPRPCLPRRRSPRPRAPARPAPDRHR